MDGGVLVIFWLLACATVDDTALTPPEPEPIALLDPADQLIRASLDLRGSRPDPEHIVEVMQDPDAYEALVERYLTDERFGRRVQTLYARWTLTETSSAPYNDDALGLEPGSLWPLSAGQEVPRVVRRIAEEDLPYDTLVTGDWTMVDDNLRRTLPVTVLGDTADTGWVTAQYDDGRPLAGVLSSSTLWLRYQTTFANANRGRANQTARLFVCTDLLSREVTFTPASLADEEALAEATRTDPSCLACHASLDPLAGYFYGFFHHNIDHPLETLSYFPARESMWRDATGIPPGYFGQPADGGLDELGARLAADPRFDACAVETAQSLVLGRDPMLEDFTYVQANLAEFEQEPTVRQLLRTMMSDPRYLAADDADPTAVPVRLATPDIVAQQMLGLTGFRWEYQGEAFLTQDKVGLGVLGGGIDGKFVTRPSPTPNVPMLLVHTRVAEAAAAWAVERGKLAGVLLEAEDAVAREAVFTQVRTHIFGPDKPGHDVAVDVALFDEVLAATGDETEAWKAWATFVLSDPDLVLY